jgi:glycosyltransferase involved in cell wall biosynthesis
MFLMGHPSVLDELAKPQAATASERRLHVAVVDEELPYPPVTGKRLRTFKLLVRLAGRHRITYLAHRNADPAEASEAARVLAGYGIEPVVVGRAVPAKSGPGFYARLAANLLSPLPYSVASHRSRALQRAIAACAASGTVDLWHCEWTPYAANLGGLTGARRLVMAHNVESLIWQRYHETEPNPLKRWYIGEQWRKFERFERRAFAEADTVVAVSPEDAALITRRFGARHVDVVDNGVDTDYFQPRPGERDPMQILFLGSLEWRPNLDAVDQLLEHVFPAVRAAEPGARLCLVGRNPPPTVHLRAAEQANVELHANVPDVRPFLARSGVLAVPLRIGGGSRLKILEALAAGVPVVSTRVGAEGLWLEPGRHLTVVERPEDMAAALVQVIRAPGPAQAQAECGRQRVLARYDWGLLADKLEQVWLASAAQPVRPDLV